MSAPSDVCLTATCHDPLGRFAAGVEAADARLARTFAALAVNVTRETHPATRSALQSLGLPTFLGHHEAGSVGIGTARTDAVALGLESGSARLFYSDLDHILRWLSSSPDEVTACVNRRGDDLVVVGRSVVAMASTPERLRATEEVVNRVYAAAHDLHDRWDLMIAMRLMTRDTAEMLVRHSRETSIATDVTWPMLVAARGGTVGYHEADGIRFLERDDFGEDGDRRDDDPREWHRRMVTATAHIAAIVDFDPSGPA